MESSLFQHFYVVNYVSFNASNHTKLIAIWIFFAQVLVTSWDSPWLVAKLVVLLSFELQFLCYKSLKLVFVLNGMIFLSNQFLGTSFPICLVILVMLSQDCKVWALELSDFLLVNDNKNGCHQFRAIGVDELILVDFILVHNVSQIFNHEWSALLLGQLV